MKVTMDRMLNDFRETMKEIVDVKNGRQKADGLQPSLDKPAFRSSGSNDSLFKQSLRESQLINSSQGTRNFLNLNSIQRADALGKQNSFHLGTFDTQAGSINLETDRKSIQNPLYGGITPSVNAKALKQSIYGNANLVYASQTRGKDVGTIKVLNNNRTGILSNTQTQSAQQLGDAENANNPAA